MNKIIMGLLLTGFIATCALAATYQLNLYDSVKLELINQSEAQPQSADWQTAMKENYIKYLENPQIMLNLVPQPKYLVQYDLMNDIWAIRPAQAISDLNPILTIERGNICRITMSLKTK